MHKLKQLQNEQYALRLQCTGTLYTLYTRSLGARWAPTLDGGPSGVIIVHFVHYSDMILIKFHVAGIIAKYEY